MSHTIIHTDKTRVILADLSRGQPRDSRSLLHVSFLVRIAMLVWCCLLSPSRIPLPYLFFSLSTLFAVLCIELWICVKKMALVPRGHWPGLEEARITIGLSTFRTGEAKTSEAEPIRYGKHIFAC